VKVDQMSDQRMKKATLRLKQAPIEYWRSVFEKINATPFLVGEGDRGWKATFDWIINNIDNADKVISGAYSGTPKKAGQYDRILGGAEHKPGEYAYLGKAGDRNAK